MARIVQPSAACGGIFLRRAVFSRHSAVVLHQKGRETA